MVGLIFNHLASRVASSDRIFLVSSPAALAADNKNIVRRKLTGYVGFANLPNQWHRKSVRKGFNFNVMVVGKLIVAHHCKLAPLTAFTNR